MEKRIAAFTIFTFLLFTVSTARIALESVTGADSDVVIPTNKPESKLDETTANDRSPESEPTQIFDVSTIDPTPRLIFSRPHPIQRRSFDRATRIPLRFVKRHPCRKFKKAFMIPTTRSYGNDMISSDKTVSVDLETIGDPIPTKWLEFKHKYGHRHRHYHHDKDEKFEMKYEFDGEKLNRISGHHKEKKRGLKGGFMRRVRKFLKHTFG
ncbi:hypothetical protein L1987_72118 [Smallanthus sonchifolius]|uniref:Uncharacterized protein n=1 Tax=Smallanthus sonchifolius TaxID=185202 RepID=A0ACB9AUB7_9ASTR|nr:hypothetical protein L1987_72118 [Smallanthus sonchifolius]